MANMQTWSEVRGRRQVDEAAVMAEKLRLERLVEFASDVAQHASEFHDRTLAHLVEDLHRDLMEMGEDE